MRIAAATAMIASLAAAGAVAGEAEVRLEGNCRAERMDALVRYCAATQPRRERSLKEGMAFWTARLLRDTQTGEAMARIDAALDTTLRRHADEHRLDPFDLHAVMNGYLICPHEYPEATVERIRRYASLYSHGRWRGYGALNYRLMQDGSGFLAAELWPDLCDAEGLDAEEVRRVTAERLFGYFDNMVRHNLDEYNAPIYFATDLMAVRMLAEFARDAEMKRRATLTLDWMLVNLACSWNQGYYVTTAGRSKFWSGVRTGPDHPGATAAVGFAYFGGKRPIAATPTDAMHAFWLAWPGEYAPPPIIARIARRRDEPFLQRESVLSPPFAMGGQSVREKDIRKVIWHTPSYSLASQWEGGIGRYTDGFFKETRRHMMKWISDRPVSTFSIQQENPYRPYRMQDDRKNHFGYGENPFHQILQHRGTQVGIYDVPEHYPYYKLYVPFPTTGSIVERIEREGWVFCHGGSVLFGFKSIEPAAWGEPQYDGDVLWCRARRNGWVLETSEPGPYAGGSPRAELEQFAAEVIENTRLDAHLAASPPRMRYTSLLGDVLEMSHWPLGEQTGDEHKINGRAVDYRAFPLMGNPWVHQEAGAPRLTLRDEEETVVYDFDRWERTSGRSEESSQPVADNHGRPVLH